MQKKQNTSVEHIIAKIGNDFNPSNSDWVGRVAAWTIDAMSQLKIFNTAIVNRELNVIDRFAVSPVPISERDIRVFTKDGREVFRLESVSSKRNPSSTGEQVQSQIETDYIEEDEFYKVSSNRYQSPSIANESIDGNFVVIGDDKIELTFNTDIIIVQNKEIESYYSETYKCDLPVIPDNGLLLEAISSYCMMKMLTRGDKHPVFNLKDNNEFTNPALKWEKLRSKVKTSVIIDRQGDNIYKSWRNMFYNATFAK